MQQDNSVHKPSTHTQQTQLRTKSMTPLCCSCCSRSFSMNGTRYPTAFFITRADLITWGRNIRPEPNRSPTTDIPCNKAIVDSRLHAGFYTARCRPPTSGSTSQLVSANNLKQCGTPWQIRWKFDYLLPGISLHPLRGVNTPYFFYVHPHQFDTPHVRNPEKYPACFSKVLTHILPKPHAIGHSIEKHDIMHKTGGT